MSAPFVSTPEELAALARQGKPGIWKPDPRNGKVYITHYVETIYEPDGQELYGPLNFMWIHISAGGNSASCKSGFASLRSAERSALKEAKRLNAIFVALPSRNQR